MLVARLAVATIFVCIGVLLLSACGLPALLPAKERSVPFDVFILRDPAAPLHALGFGSASGETDYLSGHLTLLEPQCLTGARAVLDGSITDGEPAHLRLFPRQQDEPNAFLLTASVPHMGRGYSYTLLPFTGTLQLTRGCAAGTSRNVETVLVPYIYGPWAGTAAGNAAQKPITVHLTLQQEPLDNNARVGFSGSITLRGSPCASEGILQPTKMAGLDSGPFALTFRLGDGSLLTMTLPVNFFNLGPKPVLDGKFTYAGGPCDRQSFQAHLVNR